MARTERAGRGGALEALIGLQQQTNLSLREVVALAHVGKLHVILDQYGVKPAFRSADPRVALRRLERRAAAWKTSEKGLTP